MMRAAVLGHPISHSLSPLLHGHWLQHYGISGKYEAIDTPPELLAERLSQLNEKGYQGVNLTVPLKQQVLPLLDTISPLAERIGAVNTLTFKDGQLHGENTDAFGFVENLHQAVENLAPFLHQAVVLGAGGASRAVVAGLLQAGAESILLLNRSRDKADALAQMDERIHTAEWANRNEALQGATLLVNTTSLGMQGQPALEIDLSALPQSALVTDIVYQPLITPLLQAAKQRGNPIVDGLGMLIYQAVPAFEQFFGTRPEVTSALRETLL